MDGEANCVMSRLKTIIVVILIPLIAHAEHVMETGLHGGLAGWSAKPVYVASQVGLHAGAHLYYAYYSPYVIGLRTGLTLDSHNPGFGKRDYQDVYSTIDVDNQFMDVEYTIGNLRERYSIWSVGVPVHLMLTYKRFSFLAGAKVVFPLANSWRQSADNAALSVYYPDYDNRIEESYPLAAAKSFAMSNKGRLNMPKVQWWLSAELSYAIPLRIPSAKHRSYIMVGLYADYSLTKIHTAQSTAESLIMLTDTRDGFPLQRILTPVMAGNWKHHPLVSEAALFDVGIKVSYALSSYSSRQGVKRCNCLQ